MSILEGRNEMKQLTKCKKTPRFTFRTKKNDEITQHKDENYGRIMERFLKHNYNRSDKSL